MQLSGLVRPAVAVLCLALALAGCASDDGATVRNLGSDGSPSASGDPSGTGSASGTGGECVPVNPGLETESETTVDVEALDYAFNPAEMEVASGIVTFSVDNGGSELHELAFLPGGGEVPFTDGTPDEEALGAAGAFELEAFAPGTTCNATYDLEPGTYTIFCIVETSEGVTHYELGMRATLTVTG